MGIVVDAAARQDMEGGDGVRTVTGEDKDIPVASQVAQKLPVDGRIPECRFAFGLSERPVVDVGVGQRPPPEKREKGK